MEETQKIDKRTKEYKTKTINNIEYETTDTTPYQALKNAGIPIKMSMFKTAVKFLNEAPQTEFHAPETKARMDKTATMWYTPHGLLCEKKGQTMIVPLATVGYSLPL
jgi:hypothetical protein